MAVNNLDCYLFSCDAVTAQSLKCLPSSRFRKYLSDFLMKWWDLHFYCWDFHSWLFSSPLSLPPADIRKLYRSITHCLIPCCISNVTFTNARVLNQLCPTQASSKNGFFSLTQVMTAGVAALWPNHSPAHSPPLPTHTHFSSQSALIMAKMDSSAGCLNLKRKPFPVLPCCHLCPFSPSV